MSLFINSKETLKKRKMKKTLKDCLDVCSSLCKRSRANKIIRPIGNAIPCKTYMYAWTCGNIEENKKD
jgi:hypothetical protein